MVDALDRLRSALGGVHSLTGTPPPFDPSALPDDPVQMFTEWFCAAVDGEVIEPHAATLSTVDEQGGPDARVLVLKDMTGDGSWTFASSVTSAKGRQLAVHPVAALTFFWPAQARSIRLRGPVAGQPEEVRRADFTARSTSAKAIALAGAQSEPVVDEAALDAAIADGAARLADDPDVVAEGWRVWGVRSDRIEFWPGHPSRRHVRVQYRRDPLAPAGWRTLRLTP